MPLLLSSLSERPFTWSHSHPACKLPKRTNELKQAFDFVKQKLDKDLHGHAHFPEIAANRLAAAFFASVISSGLLVLEKDHPLTLARDISGDDVHFEYRRDLLEEEPLPGFLRRIAVNLPFQHFLHAIIYDNGPAAGQAWPEIDEVSHFVFFKRKREMRREGAKVETTTTSKPRLFTPFAFDSSPHLSPTQTNKNRFSPEPSLSQ